ncbi:acyl-CoA thioesterase [Hoeflea prorocentri]|uniref:Thioesterase family protein n=1 Tax=Hoeflea prorocentri TaxID=1922333 RepID=A0A9X3UM58_9HYPH|nr:thioesterase family protein [Hoeflea prorocentri]MCY6381621.1 thioesterase family protein [Hoeflea prorocentri]MDA5399421.1 thioesterase family protein [Hoeflea prorocentri]
MPTDKTIPRSRNSYSIWTPVSIRFSDQDPLAHVNNVAITAFLESGRVGFFNQVLDSPEILARGLVLARLTVDYLNEITYPGTVEVGGRLSSIGERSVITHYAAFHGDTCCVVSESVNVFFDPETRRSTIPPEEVRAALDRLLAEQ